MNRDTLFCYHKASEEFLMKIMSLYVASHYKVSNTLCASEPMIMASHQTFSDQL